MKEHDHSANQSVFFIIRFLEKRKILHLSTEFIRQIGHRKEIESWTFRVLALRQKESRRANALTKG